MIMVTITSQQLVNVQYGSTTASLISCVVWMVAGKGESVYGQPARGEGSRALQSLVSELHETCNMHHPSMAPGACGEWRQGRSRDIQSVGAAR